MLKKACVLIRCVTVVLWFAGLQMPVSALETVFVQKEAEALDLSGFVEIHNESGANLQVSTAPDPDGIVRRIEVVSQIATPGSGSDWAVFSLVNRSEEQIDRLLVAPHYLMAGSGATNPDLGSSRIVSITPSEGFPPERLRSAEADVFLITLDPGAVITFVAELRTSSLPKLTLWEPDAYKDNINSYTLYRGIVLGISGLLAIFLTVLFVIKRASMFPATAFMAWTILFFLIIEFDFISKVFAVDAGNDQLWRASAEIAFAASLVLFIYTYLTLNRWSQHFSHVTIAILTGFVALFGVATLDASLAAGIARVSLGLIAILGFGIILFYAFLRFDRAILLVPTWIIFILWLSVTFLVVSGRFENDIVGPALSGGIVLIVLLISFTIIQHAFTNDYVQQGSVGEMERRSLAVIGSGDIIWDWDVVRNRIVTGQAATQILGIKPGALDGSAKDWLHFLHPNDRNNFEALLDAVIQQRRGNVSMTLRMRAVDGHYRFLSLRARPVIAGDGGLIRCVGTLTDVTEVKAQQERLMHNAVHDSLTSLPNRLLFMDRVETALMRVRTEGAAQPTLFIIDIDDFRSINDRIGMSVGDSMLLTVARRLSRLIKPLDTLARIGGDSFGLLLISETSPDRIAYFAESLRQALRPPMVFDSKEISLSVSAGIAAFDPNHRKAEDIFSDAEIALYHAKRMGSDCVETFRPSLRHYVAVQSQMETELQKALAKNEITVLYQPILSLKDKSLVGFNAVTRWDHLQHGSVNIEQLMEFAQRSGVVSELIAYILDHSAKNLAQWQTHKTKEPPLFITASLAGDHVINKGLTSEVKAALSRYTLAEGTLKLEFPEALVMRNPEQAVQVFERLRALGAGLALDQFGNGHSSLSHLQRLPIDTVKINRTQVKPTEAGAIEAMLKVMITIAHDLGHHTIIDGIQDESDILKFYQYGCDYMQGAYSGRLVDASGAKKLL